MVPTSPPPAEIVAQLLKRAGKCTWRPERVVLATGGGGVVGGATVGVALSAGLKLLFSWSFPLSMLSRLPQFY
jgi:hypothetical protein